MKTKRAIERACSFIFQYMVYIVNRFTNFQTNNIMEEKNLTPQESMAVISQMIEATKQRIAMPDLRISVMWAVLTIATAAVVLILSLITHNPWVNLAWFAIPVIGIPANIVMGKRIEKNKGVKTAIDRISDGIWKTVGFIAIALTVICLVFDLTGHSGAWLAMFYYAFIIVGFGAAMQGIVLKERSYIFGGTFSIIAGFVLIGLTLCRIPLLMVWVIPLYMLCFLLMFIVPAFVIRKKLNDEQR